MKVVHTARIVTVTLCVVVLFTARVSAEPSQPDARRKGADRRESKGVGEGVEEEEVEEVGRKEQKRRVSFEVQRENNFELA